MPRRRRNNVEYGRVDDDLVPLESQQSRQSQPSQPSQPSTRKRPRPAIPPYRPLPLWEPINIENPYDRGQPRLPPEVDSRQPLATFRLFWTDKVVQNICYYTNEMARRYPPKPLNSIART